MEFHFMVNKAQKSPNFLAANSLHNLKLTLMGKKGTYTILGSFTKSSVIRSDFCMPIRNEIKVEFALHGLFCYIKVRLQADLPFFQSSQWLTLIHGNHSNINIG